MSRVVRVMLDDATDRLLRELQARMNVSESEVIALGLRLLASPRARVGVSVMGVGRFDSGRGDLGSNKAHLRQFGSAKKPSGH
jgi:hypothetical protein